MRSPYDRSRDELESTLKRVAKRYAEGKIGKNQFDKFDKTIQAAFTQINTMEEEDSDGQA